MEFKFSPANSRIPYPHTKRSGFTIASTPSEKFPQLVTIIKGSKKYKEMIGKKYLDYKAASIAVDAYMAENTIQKVTKNAKKDLLELGLEEYL